MPSALCTHCSFLLFRPCCLFLELLLLHRCELRHGVQRTTAIKLALWANTPLAPLSLSHTASCSPVIFRSLHPPVKPSLKAYLINALTIFAIFVIQLNRIHFTVCTFDSKRTEQSELRAENWKRRAHNSLIWHERWHFTEMANTSHVAGCDCWSWRTVSWPTHHSVAATHIELKMTVFCFLELEVLVAVVFFFYFLSFCACSVVFNFQRANTKWA